MFGNPKGELRICQHCRREHDILRGTKCWCACGQEIKSKEYKEEGFDLMRNKVQQLHKNILWYQKRSLLPYDAGTYWFPLWSNILDYFKIDFSDGHLKKQDKRGSWR